LILRVLTVALWGRGAAAGALRANIPGFGICRFQEILPRSVVARTCVSNVDFECSRNAYGSPAHRPIVPIAVSFAGATGRQHVARATAEKKQQTNDLQDPMNERIAKLYNGIVLSHPRLVILVLLLIVGYFAAHAPDFKLDASSDSLLLENDADLIRYQQVVDRYGMREFLFVTITPSDDLFAPEVLEMVGELRDDLEALDTVHSVISILDVPLVRNLEFNSLADVTNNFRLLESPDVDVDRAREELLSSPIYKNLVVSPDGLTTAIQIFLVDFPEFRLLQDRRNKLLYKRDNEGLTEAETAELELILANYLAEKRVVEATTHRAVADIRAVMAKYGDHAQLHLGGVPMIVDDMITFIRNDLAIFGTGVVAFLVIMLSVIFREARWVALPLLSCAFGTTVMVGFLGLVGWEVTVISSNFISLMLIITMSMNIHLIVRYRELYRDISDADQDTLVRETTRHMVRPCLYTAVTTIIAFASLVVSDIKPVMDFGWMMTMGLVVVFVTSFTLFPSLLLILGKRPLKRVESEHYPFTEMLSRFTERHGALVLAISVATAVLGVAGVQRLEVENSFIDYFHDDTEIYQGLKLIDDVLGGTTPAEIIIKFSPEDEGDEESDEFGFDAELEELFGDIETRPSDHWFTPEKIDRIKAVHDYLDSLPAVGKVLSLASTIRLAESLNEGNEFGAFELNVLYKRIPAALKAAVVFPFLSIENDEARVSIRIIDSLPDLRRKELLEQIEYDLQHKVGLAPEEFEITGLLVLYNNYLQSLFSSQIETLGVVMVGIMMMLWILFRSFRIAVIGIIPNILAATTILGFMGWMGIPLDIMTITIAAITIGIAVDDCIHYLYRFREELPTYGDYVVTMHYCHDNIAKAAFYTTLTVTVGFSILVMSNFVPTVLFGLLTAVAMVIALLAALTLMPKLILMMRPFKIDPVET
jgi:predicted RND superfamily exporter protein